MPDLTAKAVATLDWLTPREVADAAGVPEEVVARWCESGVLAGERYAGGWREGE
jgi:hypothetical protein